MPGAQDLLGPLVSVQVGRGYCLVIAMLRPFDQDPGMGAVEARHLVAPFRDSASVSRGESSRGRSRGPNRRLPQFGYPPSSVSSRDATPETPSVAPSAPSTSAK